MKEETTGWVIVCYKYPSTGSDWIVSSTYSSLRKEAIQKSVSGSGAKWDYWKRKYNFKCIKAKSIIELI